MSTRFAFIFWGLLLVILDIRLNGLDILPDILGYILIAIGCSGLVSYSTQFASACGGSAMMIILLCIGYLTHDNEYFGFKFICYLVDCIMIWSLLGGVMDLAMERNRMDLYMSASNRRRAYMLIMFIATTAEVVLQYTVANAILVGILVLSVILILIMILHLIHRAKHELTKHC